MPKPKAFTADNERYLDVRVESDLDLLEILRTNGYWKYCGVKIAQTSDWPKLQKLLMDRDLCTATCSYIALQRRVQKLDPFHKNSWFHTTKYSDYYKRRQNDFEKFFVSHQYYQRNLRKRRRLEHAESRRIKHASYSQLRRYHLGLKKTKYHDEYKQGYDVSHIFESGVHSDDSIYDEHDGDMDPITFRSCFEEYVDWSDTEEPSALPESLQKMLKEKTEREKITWYTARRQALDKRRRHGWDAVKNEFVDQVNEEMSKSTDIFKTHWQKQNRELQRITESCRELCSVLTEFVKIKKYSEIICICVCLWIIS
eukprot:230717_1